MQYQPATESQDKGFVRKQEGLIAHLHKPDKCGIRTPSIKKSKIHNFPTRALNRSFYL